MKLEAIQSKGSLTDKAYDILKESILSLDLKPGQVIIEDDISKELGISRTPLRAALQKLSFEYLIEIVPGKGTCVTKLSTKYFLDLFDLREVVEILCVKLAALNRTGEDIINMNELLKMQHELAFKKPLDKKTYLDVDQEIHLLFAKCSKNKLVEKQIIRLNESYNRYLRFTNFSDRAVTVIKEHMMIANAIEKRDSIKAQSLMKGHLKDVKESILIDIIGQDDYYNKL